MSLPVPYAESDDQALVDGCVRGDDDAWKALFTRYGGMAEVVLLDDESTGEVDDTHERRAWLVGVEDYLRRNQAAALRAWSRSSCSLRAYLTMTAHRVARRHSDETPARASLVAYHPTPSALRLEDIEVAARSVAVSQVLARLPPNSAALVRLRLRGMDLDGISRTVGLSSHAVARHLEKIAVRLAENESDPQVRDHAILAWRVLLGAADAATRAAVAVRTEDEPGFRDVRARAEAVLRDVRASTFDRVVPETPLCLDDRGIAGFVDGTLRGATRARSEGHVSTCPRCADAVAALGNELRVAPIFRDGAKLDGRIVVAAALLALTRFDIARRRAERIDTEEPADARAARAIARLAVAASFLVGGRGGRAHTEASGLLVRGIPADDEAHVVAFEALVAGDSLVALRAIDEELAKEPVPARLRFLATAAHDHELGRQVALELRERPQIDPGMVEDVEVLLSLPAGRALPRESLVERLRDVLPEVVRLSLIKSSRLKRA